METKCLHSGCTVSLCARPVQLAGRYGDGYAVRAQPPRKFLAHDDGTMLPARASDGDGHEMLVLVSVAFQRHEDGPLVCVQKIARTRT